MKKNNNTFNEILATALIGSAYIDGAILVTTLVKEKGFTKAIVTTTAAVGVTMAVVNTTLLVKKLGFFTKKNED